MMEKKIKVIKKFKDLKHNSILRNVGDVLIEPDERADFLIEKGFTELVEVLQPKVEVETAVVEVKKEKAVKEKAVKSATKKETKKEPKKNAKK